MASFVARTVLLFAVMAGYFHLVSSRGLRLNYYSSTTLPYGRLEIYNLNQWIPFTITGFNMYTADLACKSMGYTFAARYARVGFLGYSPAATNYSVSNLRCSINTPSFISCSYSTTSSYSSYYNVGLQCTNSRSSVRLLPSGRLQIFINNTWGTVCDDDFGDLEAGIACGQLGFIGYDGYRSAGNSPDISGPIWLDKLNQCSHSSMDLRNCTNVVGVNDCEHTEDVILRCDDHRSQGDLRLVSFNFTSKFLSEGRLEVYYINRGQLTWMPFCYPGFSDQAADLACQKLGYSRSSRYDTVENLGYVQSLSSDHISSVNCVDQASQLDSGCQFYVSSLCSGSSEVAITCVNNNSAGLIVGSVIGGLVLLSLLFIGIVCCVVAIAIIFHKKRTSQVRIVNVAKNRPEVNYRMSDLSAQQTDSATSNNSVLQDKNQGNFAIEEETTDHIEEMHTSDDKKPLVY